MCTFNGGGRDMLVLTIIFLTIICGLGAFSFGCWVYGIIQGIREGDS